MTGQHVDYNRKWFTMAAVAIGTFLATFSLGIVNAALPTLAQTFQVNFIVVRWIVLVYLLTVTALIMSVSRLAGMIGKKLPYLAGFMIFSMGALLCGLAPKISWLIGARIVQGIGAAMIMALSMAILTEAFPPQERGKAVGILSSVMSFGFVIGPIVGGTLLDSFSWRWLFFIKLPIGIAGAIMTAKHVQHITPKGKHRFDYLGAVTLFFSLLFLLLGVTIGQRLGFNHLLVLLLLGGWLLLLGTFIEHESQVPQPMIDLKLFRNRLFSVSLIAALISFIGMGGTLILLPFYLQNVLSIDMVTMGILLSFIPLMVGITAPIGGFLADRFGSPRIAMIGLSILIIGYWAASTLTPQISVPWYLLRLLPIGIGMGIFQSSNTSSLMGAVPRERLAIASGLFSITSTIGQAMGASVLGTVWAIRTLFHAEHIANEVIEAPAVSQVKALHDTFLVMVAFVALALVISSWGQIRLLRYAVSRSPEKIDA